MERLQTNRFDKYLVNILHTWFHSRETFQTYENSYLMFSI